MTTETIAPTLQVLGIGSIIGGVIGAAINHWFEVRRETQRRIAERKEAQYKTFLETLIGFFEGWHDVEKKKNFMEELYTHAPLYASDEVIKLSNEFLRSFDSRDLKHGGKSDVYYRKLVLAIRKDLKKILSGKSKLKEDDIDVKKLNV